MELHFFTIYGNVNVNVRITFPHTVYQTLHQISPNLIFLIKIHQKRQGIICECQETAKRSVQFEHAFEMAC
jgi:hypothetical protein